jgi:hypothetical protein
VPSETGTPGPVDAIRLECRGELRDQDSLPGTPGYLASEDDGQAFQGEASLGTLDTRAHAPSFTKANRGVMA